jgi:CheY-like chemotaxis protein
MARLLLIDPDRGTVAALQEALAVAGLTDVSAVISGSFALTMLERDRPDLIVSRARIPDIDGYELCGIVRSDPEFTGILFVVLADAEDEVPAGAFEEGGADRILVGAFSPETIVTEVRSLLAARTIPESESESEPVPVAVAAAPGGLRGSLDVMDLAEVAQAIALGGKTGHLVLALASGEGTVVFDRGRIVHAEFGQLVGEPAFTALVVTSHRAPGGTFFFNPMEAATSFQRTIERSVESLLLSTAAGIDEGRADTAAGVSSN